jgi:hypothetical protein
MKHAHSCILAWVVVLGKLLWLPAARLLLTLVRYLTMPVPFAFPSRCDIRDPMDYSTDTPGAVVHADIPCRLVPTSRIPVYGPLLGEVAADYWIDLPSTTSIVDPLSKVTSVAGGAVSIQPALEAAVAQVIECPPSSGDFFLVLWVERRYRDTPAEYLRAYLQHGPFIPG